MAGIATVRSGPDVHQGVGDGREGALRLAVPPAIPPNSRPSTEAQLCGEGMSENGGLKYIGTRPVRPDGVDKVTGRAEFGADWVMPDMVFGKVVRSSHAHARICSVDTSRAEALPGVLAVVTAADFPDRSGFRPRRRAFVDNLMASDKVLFHGHPVAAVAAASNRIAELAADLVAVDYEVLGARYRCPRSDAAGGAAPA